MNRKYFAWHKGQDRFIEVNSPKKPLLTQDRHTFLWAMVAFLSAQMFVDAVRRSESDVATAIWTVMAFGWTVVGVINLVKMLFGRRVD